MDEIHALSLDAQGQLLRVLQEGEYRPVGGKHFLTADVRILSASNRPLLKLVREGRFREDLYYRLNVLRIQLPSLRERGQDVFQLAKHFLTQIREQEELGNKTFRTETLRALAHYDYPGNVRELKNVVEKAAVLSRSDWIEVEDLFFDSNTHGPQKLQRPSDYGQLPLKEAKEEFQRAYIERLLDHHGGVVARAARGSGITRESFHRLMKKYGVRRASGPGGSRRPPMGTH